MDSGNLAAWVRKSLENYLRGDRRFPHGFEDLARDQELLPLGKDLAYAYFLNADGVLFWEDALDREAGICRIEDEGERHRIIRGYSRDFPELLSLLPARPSHVPTCVQCGGSGFMHLRSTTGSTHEFPCCMYRPWVDAGCRLTSACSWRALQV